MSRSGAVGAGPGSGRLLVLEGGEGVGKTTQWRHLAGRLRAAGHDVVALREPGGTPVGEGVRTLLLDPDASLTPATEALLFAASRAQLVAEAIRPALAAGRVVLLDRFLLSTYAYQGAGRGLSMADLRAANRVATDGVVPHLTLLLTLPLEVALARAAGRGPRDRLERESDAFHARVAEAFHAATTAAWQAAHPEVGPVAAVDATGAEDAVTARCLAAIDAAWGPAPVPPDGAAGDAAAGASAAATTAATPADARG